MKNILCLIVVLFNVFIGFCEDDLSYFSGLISPADENADLSRSDVDRLNYQALPQLVSYDASTEQFSGGHKHQEVQPDVGLFLDKRTIRTWSSKFLEKEDSPLKHVGYDVYQNSMLITVTFDNAFIKSMAGSSYIRPAYAPGESFVDVNDRKAFQRQLHEKEPFLLELALQLHFPIAGKYENNAIYIQFSRQAARTYYASDYKSFLTKRNELLKEIRALRKARRQKAEVVIKMEKMAEDDSVSENDLMGLVDAEDTLQTKITDHQKKVHELELQIANFKSGTSFPLMLTPDGISAILESLKKSGAVNPYLNIELVEQKSDDVVGVIKVSRLDKAISMAVPGLSIYYAGITKDPDTGVNKLYIAGRLPDEL